MDRNEIHAYLNDAPRDGDGAERFLRTPSGLLCWTHAREAAGDIASAVENDEDGNGYSVESYCKPEDTDGTRADCDGCSVCGYGGPRCRVWLWNLDGSIGYHAWDIRAERAADGWAHAIIYTDAYRQVMDRFMDPPEVSP